jgi:hypothetical protein
MAAPPVAVRPPKQSPLIFVFLAIALIALAVIVIVLIRR